MLVSPFPDGKRWVLVSKLNYDVGCKGSGYTIIVGNGFITDFASVPRLLWLFMSCWGIYGNGAVIHDWLYWQQYTSRREADAIFLEAMTVLKTPKFKKFILYRAVRWFGAIAWHRNARLKAQGETRMIQNVSLSVGLNF